MLRRVIAHPAFWAIAGIIASFVFYNMGKSDAIAEQLEAGRKEGHQLGLQEATDAFEENLPTLIEQRYPGVLAAEKQISFSEGEEAGRADGRETGFAEGIAQGRVEGDAAGYKRGFAAGKVEGDAEGYARGREDGFSAGETKGYSDGYGQATVDFSLQMHAEQNWEIYESYVSRLAKIADDLNGSRGDAELQSLLRSEALVLVESAQSLQEAYLEQSASFNSLVNSLNDALEANNFPRLREIARALERSMDTKRLNFLQANQNIEAAFISLQR
jgi:flagellar biosynthesis/type III secretory pathway protein FliH